VAAALPQFVFAAGVWFCEAPGLSRPVLMSAFAKKKPQEPSAPPSGDRASPGDPLDIPHEPSAPPSNAEEKRDTRNTPQHALACGRQPWLDQSQFALFEIIGLRAAVDF
jgi:hypothetical protein